MATLPPIIPKTKTAIFAAYEAAREGWEPVGINVGDLAKACSRALFYDFRRVSDPEVIEGRKLRIFETGNIEETRLLNNLRSIGCEVANEQARVRFVGGHVRGKIDAEATGVIEAPKRVHLVECKSSNDKGFKILEAKGVKVGKPLHYGQCQMYMHGRSLERALYLCVNKDNDDIYVERVPYDVEYCLRMLARAESVITVDDPPSKLHEAPIVECLWCRHRSVCHEDKFPRRNCRTCLHSTPVLTSQDACWNCAKWNKPLTLAEQEAACPSHLYLPGLVPGKQVDADVTAETVTYALNSGATWINGAEA